MPTIDTDLNRKDVQKIAILGAESSGKSALAEALALRYKTLWVPEYLREFVETHARVPRAEEQFLIATTQCQRELQLMPKANAWLFCDTAPLMTEIYSDYYFDEADAGLLALAAEHKTQYGFTLVTAPDFPWVADGLQRESPAVRQRIHDQLLEVLEERDIPHLLLEGSLIQRLAQVEFAFSFLMQ